MLGFNWHTVLLLIAQRRTIKRRATWSIF